MFLIALLSPILCLRLAQAITVQELPQCAQQCLSNSTAVQLQCSVIDIACLCSSSTYVAALSCCLYQKCDSDEQASAIQFNKQECAAVNETAPDFVGCSPAGLSSFLASASLSPLPTSTTSSSMSLTATSSVSPQLSTVSGDVDTETQASITTGTPSVATFAGRPLMTGSCTVPYFALASDATGALTEFPMVGCSGARTDCCPFNDGVYAAVTRCPQDYFTTASACCPLGYQVYSTAIGVDTPCYSVAATNLIPAVTPTVSGLTLITDRVFAPKYALVTSSPSHSKLSLGGKIGIIVTAVLFLALLVAAVFYLRRRKKAAAQVARSTTFPPEEPTLPMAMTPVTHELDSPEALPRSRGTTEAPWPMLPASSPPAYDQTTLHAGSPQSSMPQELPGSTFIHEHHPAFVPHERSTETSAISSPQTPTASAAGSEKRSPGLSATTPRSGTQSPLFVSPLTPPKPPRNSPYGDKDT